MMFGQHWDKESVGPFRNTLASSYVNRMRADEAWMMTHSPRTLFPMTLGHCLMIAGRFLPYAVRINPCARQAYTYRSNIMRSATLVRWGGVAVMVGGVLQLVWGLITYSWLRTQPSSMNIANAGVAISNPLLLTVVTLLLAVATGLYLCAPLGLHALHATGSGWFGKIGTAIAVLGLVVYMAGVLYLGIKPDSEGEPLGSVGHLTMVLGMLLLGIATLRARRLPGWKAWMPLLTALYFVVMPFVPLPFLLSVGMWGVVWAGLGYVLWSAQSAMPVGEMAA